MARHALLIICRHFRHESKNFHSMPKKPAIQYKIVYSRRKTLAITISPVNGVVVRAPLRTRASTVDIFVREKYDWIKKTIDRFSSLERIDNPEGYSNGDHVLLFGKTFKLNLYPAENYHVKMGRDGIIDLGFKDDDNPLLIREMLEKWFRHIARGELSARFAGLLLKFSNYGFQPSSFAVRRMKKRWGSCSSTGKIAVSYDLIRLDPIYSEYVIIHELCHLLHHNHGPEFYRLLSGLFPQWKTVRNNLQGYIR